MTEWKTYRPTQRVWAREFRSDQEWPEMVHPWPDEEGRQPRDGSYGYIIDVRGEQSHVFQGSYIVHGIVPDTYFVVGADRIKREYELMEDEAPPVFLTEGGIKRA